MHVELEGTSNHLPLTFLSFLLMKDRGVQLIFNLTIQNWYNISYSNGIVSFLKSFIMAFKDVLYSLPLQVPEVGQFFH